MMQLKTLKYRGEKTMAKNYLFTHKILDERQGKICDFNELTASHINHQTYIHKFIRPAV